MPHVAAAVDELRGAGAAAAKSTSLASVSPHPPDPRAAAVVLSIASARRTALVVGCGAVADEVGDRGDGGAAPGRSRHRRAPSCSAPLRPCRPRRRGSRCRSRPGPGSAAADRPSGGELDEVVAAGCDRPGERGHLPRRARRRRVLERPAGDVDRGRAAVEELDEVVREGRAGISAAREHLADDDVGRRAAGDRHGERADAGDEGARGEGLRLDACGAPIGEEDGTPSLISRCQPRRKGRGANWHRVGTLRHVPSDACRPREREGYCPGRDPVPRAASTRQLPRSVQTLQLGGLVSAFGNGMLIPFLFIYLHNVRDIGLGVAGLIVGANAVVSVVAGPSRGVARRPRTAVARVLAASLVVLAVGYGAFALVARAVAGVRGSGCDRGRQRLLLAGAVDAAGRALTARPSACDVRDAARDDEPGDRDGALVGGLIADADRPGTFVALFLLDAVTFVVYLGVLLVAVPEPRTASGGRGDRTGQLPRRPPPSRLRRRSSDSTRSSSSPACPGSSSSRCSRRTRWA